MTKINRPITAEIEAVSKLHYYGDCIAHGWSKHIGKWHAVKKRGSDETRRVWRSRPFAQRLLARVLWMYQPTPITNESTGEVVGYRRKFHGDYWRISFGELADEFGCSTRTLYDELDLLRELGLVRTLAVRQVAKGEGAKRSPLYVIPIASAIAKITPRPERVAAEDSSKAGEETSPVASEETSVEPVKKLQPTSYPSLTPESSSPEVGEGTPDFDADAAARAAGIDKQPPPPRKSKKVEPPKAPTITTEQLQHFAVSAHREIVGVLLDAFCVQQIISRVTDETSWRECLTDWRLHTNWRTDNIAGQLDRYARWAEIKAQSASAPPLKRPEPINGAPAGTLTGAAKIAQETYERQMGGIQSAVEAAMAGGWYGNA